MPNYEVITKAGYQDKRWQVPGLLSHAREAHLCMLLGEEFPKAVVEMPIAFARINERLLPIALLGLLPGKNLYLGPDGKWLGQYVPAQFRKHPFQLVKDAQGHHHLAIDTTAGCIVDNAAQGEAFFTEDSSEPSEKIKSVLQFLTALLRSEAATLAACELLQRHDLLVPWMIAIKTPDGEKKLEGLLHIDEAKLNALGAEALKEVQQGGALLMAMCQLLSEQHLPKLGKLAELHAKMVPATQVPDSGTFAGLSQGGTLNLSGLV